MIFVTVGSQLPFDRLVAPTVAWARSRGRRDVVFQHGGGAIDLEGFEAHAFLPPDRAERLISEAELVVGHVGMGTILSCLEHGTPIVAMPRRADLRETRNDHQLDTARQLGGRGGIFVATTDSELVELLDRAAELRAGARIGATASPDLIDALARFIHRPDSRYSKS